MPIATQAIESQGEQTFEVCHNDPNETCTTLTCIVLGDNHDFEDHECKLWRTQDSLGVSECLLGDSFCEAGQTSRPGTREFYLRLLLQYWTLGCRTSWNISRLSDIIRKSVLCRQPNGHCSQQQLQVDPPKEVKPVRRRSFLSALPFALCRRFESVSNANSGKRRFRPTPEPSK